MNIPPQRSRRPMAEINLVPFIDVMLVLLVIFMITTPLLTQGVKIDLPQTESKAIPPDQQEPLIVTVDSAGQFFLNISSKYLQASRKAKGNLCSFVQFLIQCQEKEAIGE